MRIWSAGMDKVRERGAPLPGNDKENWGNRHNGIWRKREEGRKKKRRKEQKKKNKYRLRNLQRKRKSILMINLYQATLMNEENWIEIETTEMRKNVKKKDEEENWRIAWIGKENAGSEMEENKRKGMKSSNKRKRGKCQGILRKSSQWCNWDMMRKRRVRKKKRKWKRRKKEVEEEQLINLIEAS